MPLYTACTENFAKNEVKQWAKLDENRQNLMRTGKKLKKMDQNMLMWEKRTKSGK